MGIDFSVCQKGACISEGGAGEGGGGQGEEKASWCSCAVALGSVFAVKKGWTDRRKMNQNRSMESIVISLMGTLKCRGAWHWGLGLQCKAIRVPNLEVL